MLHEVNLPLAFGSPDWNGGLAAPTIANIDDDIDLEIVINTSHSGVVAYDLPGTIEARVLWGTGRGNYYRNGIPSPSCRLLHTDSNYTLYDIHPFSHSEIYAVGSNGIVRYWDGNQWTTISSGTNQNLYGVWGIEDTGKHLFVVGGNGLIKKYDGSQWYLHSAGTQETLNAVWGTAPDDVFAVGNNGAICHYDGNSWSVMSVPTLQYDCNNCDMQIKWQNARSSDQCALFAVWGRSSQDVYAVGNAGVILHYDGTQWSQMTSNTNYSLYGIWGTGQVIYAVGRNGTLLRYLNTWQSIPSRTSYSLFGIGGLNQDNVLASGNYGTLVNHNGSQPALLRANSLAILFNVKGHNGIFYAVGTNGIIEACH